MLKKIVLVFAAVALAKAQIPSLGWCPEYVPMANFDMNKFLGVWYEAERYFQLTEVVSRCVTANYTRGLDGKVRVSNEVTNRFTGIKRVLEGEIKAPASKSEEGKLQVKYTTVPLTPETQYSVLETDYNNYAVLWSCSGIGPIHAQNAWLMTRKRFAAGDVMQLAYGVLDKYKITRRFFVKTDQAECAYEPPEQPAPVASTAAPVTTVAEATGPVKEPVVDESSAARKAAEGIILRSAIATPVDEAIDETKSEKVAADQVDAPKKLANPEPAEIAAPEEKPTVDEVKVEESQVKAIAPATIPEVILKVAESAKEAPVAEETQSNDHPVAEESNTVEVVVPAEAKPESSEAVLLPETTKSVEEPKPEVTLEESEAEAVPIEEPIPTVKLAEEPKPVEVLVASEVAEESKPLEPLPGLKSSVIATIEEPLEEAEKIESPAPIVLLDAVLTKSVDDVLPVEAVEEVKIAEVPVAPEAPVDSVLIKTLESPEPEESKLVVLEAEEPAQIAEGDEQSVKNVPVPEIFVETAVQEVSTAEESKPLEAKP